jgi:hypothetical protein
MIDRCFNPVCRRTLQYLRDGRVVRVIRGKDADISVEHYWLCGACYEDHNFVFSPDGAVSLEPRSHEEHADEFTFWDVVLPERRNKRAPGVDRKPSLRASSPFSVRGPQTSARQ